MGTSDKQPTIHHFASLGLCASALNSGAYALLPIGLLLLGSVLGAQPRPQRAAHVCVASHHQLGVERPEDAMVINALDPAAPLRLLLTDDGGLLFFRSREGGLTVALLDGALRSVVSTREMSIPVGQWAVSAARSGIGVAYIENRRELLLARLSPTGEARNVPRVLYRSGTDISALTIARTTTGFVLAWTRTGQPRIEATITNRLGVPEGEPYSLTEGALPQLTWLDEAQTPVLMALASAEPTAPTISSLDRNGRAITSYRWPSGAVGPVEHSGGLWALEPGPVFARITAAGASPTGAETSPDASVPLAFARGARGVAVLLRDGRTGHSLVTITQPDCVAPNPVLLRYAIATTLSMRENAAVLIARETVAHATLRLSVITVTCPEVQRGR